MANAAPSGARRRASAARTNARRPASRLAQSLECRCDLVPAAIEHLGAARVDADGTSAIGVDIGERQANVVVDRDRAGQTGGTGVGQRGLRRPAHLQLVLHQARQLEVVALGQRLGDVHGAARTQHPSGLGQRRAQIGDRNMMERAHEHGEIHRRVRER